MATATRALAPLLAVGQALVPMPASATRGPAVAADPSSPEVTEAPVPTTAPSADPAEPAEPHASPDEDEPPAARDESLADERPIDAEPTAPEPVEQAPAEQAPADAEPIERERVDASGGTPVAGRSGAARVDDTMPDVPERMRTMQAAAWWTIFGAFAVGTTAGVFAGLAMRQQDRALRLATVFEADTARQPLYTDKRDEYDAILRRGRAYQGTAIALGAVAGAATVAAAVLFIVDERRRKRDDMALRVLPTGLEVRF